MTAFMIRANANGKSYLDMFRNNNMVAVGWGGSGDLRSTSKEDVIKNLAIKHDCYGHGTAAATIAIYGVFNAKLHDIVVMPNGDYIYLGEVTSLYEYDPTDSDASHILGVKWDSRLIPRNCLSDNLQRALKNRRTFASLDFYTDELNSIIHGGEIKPVLASVNSSYTFTYAGTKSIMIAGIPEKISEKILDEILSKLKSKLKAEDKLID